VGFFLKIGGFFKYAAAKVNVSILKPIGNFIRETVPTYVGKIIDSIKGVSKAVINKVPVVIDKVVKLQVK